ncbi:LamG-like jellyroll fold domain-containing protein [Sphingobacterium bovistauri]|uniref:DUF4983 domain-containing protein n=1 Tax=Sphingobacterium bovistauri TaxID=2781959 RepID=A0ABS7Z6L4_9SPHI|nr:LamG-like jellyroll fold domain-containing protein [Sphingobacterium bovistauri]MCA5005818.1 DUF4983 domain-containing protein [Sphingobacterium bovistauri]
MKRRFLNIFSLLLAVMAVTGCTKYYNPDPNFEEYEQEVEKTVKRKVLFISIDGLVGQELKKKIPTNLAELMKSGKYSFDALTDSRTSDPASWATMATGYSYGKHLIDNDNYLPTPNSDKPHDDINFVPSVIYRLEDQHSTLRTSIVVQDEGLANVLLMDADDNILVQGDGKVKDEVKALFSKSAPDFTVVQFKDVLAAGKSSSFSMSETSYSAAVERVDGFIGEIVQAIKSREDYSYEDWLIIITSSHGGVGSSYGGDSFAERNVFSLYYQKDLKGQELIPEIIISPHFYGGDGTEGGPKEGVRARNTAAVAGEENYNISKTGQLTIEAKVKINKNAAGTWSYTWPPFLSKVNARSGSTAGWSFFRNGNNVSLYCADGSTKLEIGGGPISVDDKWAHMTGVFSSNNGVVTSKLYVDGNKVAEGSQKLNINNVLSTSPLTFGFQANVFSAQFLDLHLADIYIWNIALNDDEVRENSKRMGVPDAHPKKSNLIGYWPMDDGGAVLKNKVNGMPNIPLQGNYQYKVKGNNLPYVDENAILIQNVDVTRHVFYWLGINPHENWGLEGTPFLSKFELEFLK